MSMLKYNKVRDSAQVQTNEDMKDIFSNLKYICNSTSLIVESLQRGLDVAQLPSGDVIVTEVKTINTQYSWDEAKQRMVKISQN
jgi:hypothetical protein